MHDLVIKNAQICDGLGGPAKSGDLAVSRGRIAAMGTVDGEAREVVDGDGLVLAPGIIDVHTHYDAQLTWDPFARPSPALGVTTVVIGNCGFTIAPCRPADRDLTIRNLTHVEGMPLEALRAGIVWDFETFPDYVAALERRGVVPNVACFVGHSSLRTFVMGPDATKRAATRDEINRMKSLVREALDAGAIGFATSTLEGHNGENGVPVPSRFAEDDEFRALVGALGESGRGLFQLTAGAKSTIPFLESLAAESGRPVSVCAMLIDPAVPERVFEDMARIGEARARGRELYGQVSCFPESLDFDLVHPFPFEAVISWRPALESRGVEALRAVLKDPSFRDAVKAEMRTPGTPFRFTTQWNDLTIKRTARPENRALEGANVAQQAARSGVHPLDWMLDFALSEDLATEFNVLFLNADEDRVKNLLLDPSSLIALGDAGAHLSLMCQAGTGLHLFGHWVRERGDLALVDAIREMTSWPAAAYRIRDRGRLAVGAWADLLLFDPRTVGIGPREVRHDLPTGSARIDTPARGVVGVWVNGSRVVDERGPIENCPRAGKVLRDFDA